MNLCIKKTYTLILLFLLNVSYASEIVNTNVDLSGVWKRSCDNFSLGGYLNISSEKNIMEVNHNQIYIIFDIKNKKNTYYLYLDHPSDLGRGGMQLSWDDFSRVAPIANFVISNKNEITMRWLGFSNYKNKKHFWDKKAEILSESDSNQVILYRCEVEWSN